MGMEEAGSHDNLNYSSRKPESALFVYRQFKQTISILNRVKRQAKTLLAGSFFKPSGLLLYSN